MKTEAVSKDAVSPDIEKSKEEKNTQENKNTDGRQSNITDENITVSKSGLKAGPKQIERKQPQLPEPKPYSEAPFIKEFDFKPGDFIRYVKEDNIVYQGEILQGQPVEHDFQYYPGQDDDYVVQLEFKDGKHVAENKVQKEDNMNVMMAREKTSYGRNIETVSPEEIIAVSPVNQFNWYKLEEQWDLVNNEYDIIE